MNPQDRYQALRDQLEKFETRLNQMRSLSVWAVEAKNIERSHLKIQELFQTQILDQISPAEELNIPHYVEINKQLRLLGADIKLLKTARLGETLNKRIDQACDRLTLLFTYCDALLGN
jgi:hypothetical protein